MEFSRGSESFTGPTSWMEVRGLNDGRWNLYLPSPALGDSWRLGRQRNFPEGHPTPAGQASLGPHQKSLRAALSSPWPPLTPPGAPLGLGLGWTPLQSSVGGCWAGREGAREGGKAAFSGETAKAGRTPPKSVLFS